ncbi:hypothetical protein RDWZM_005970 [Blomia tropicalis]|uniref:28S ribosomal protein S22, mitochondrial n=1 Tax=Blomia tropicalis TaxID=40697 RepID=A0A9Q0M504_BLOTA|nr:hypothetical protein RDWZM_005970 [Blomia tropicalis]
MRYLKLLLNQKFRCSSLSNWKNLIVVANNSNILQSRFLSQDSSHYDPLKLRTDMEELFLDKRVRFLLKRLTGYNPEKLFERKSLQNLSSPKYRFMTDEQLRMERETSNKMAEKMLQMPPVKYAKELVPRVLEKDSALEGFLDSSVKMIFLDATPGFSDIDRLIVVREADGTLREATRDERHRTNQIFYPIEERHIDLPKMFEDPYTDDVLKREAYKLLLDNACLHFEPEDERFINLCHRTYDHIASRHAFDSLLSTRHYGGMVYYYVYFRRVDHLLHYLVCENRLENAFQLLQLFYIVNPSENVPISWNDSQSTDIPLSKLEEFNQNEGQLVSITLEQFVNLLKFYIANDSSNLAVKPRLQLNLQKLEEQLIDDSEVAKN